MKKKWEKPTITYHEKEEECPDEGTAHIKSADLCDRCVFDMVEWCLKMPCAGCKMGNQKADTESRCRCDTIKTGTPCPFFRERDGK